MKKLYCIMICGLTGIFTAFAQAEATDSVWNITGESVVTETAAAQSVSVVTVNAETMPAPDQPGAAEAVAAKTEVYAAKEMNEPTQRFKARAFSMHMGFTFAATAANNMISIPDIFKPELVIDLNKLSKSTMKSGLHAGGLFNLTLFSQFTVLGEHTIRFSTTVDANGWTNLSKSLVDLFAKGNAEIALGKTIDGTFNAKLTAFADTGIAYRLKKPSYGFYARLAYFIPLAYMENPGGTYSVSPKKSGDVIDGMTINAEGTADIYGYLPIRVLGGSMGNSGVADMFKRGGLDLSLEGAFRPAAWITVKGGIDYMPLMIVTMNKGIRGHFKYEGTLDNLLNTLGEGKSPFTQNTVTDMNVADLPTKKIMRPCKLRLGGDFRPLQNDYLILSPFLAFPVINAKPYYVDGGLKVESRFAGVLGAYFDTGCIERIWRHELCFFVDSRWCTFQLAASVASHDFKRTFTSLSGVGLKLGIGIGF